MTANGLDLGPPVSIDSRAYAKLLRKTLPAVIKTEEQNEHFIEVLDRLTRHGDPAPEELAIADLLAVLIEDFEEKHYALKPATPLGALNSLIEERGLKQKELVDVFGTESIVSEVLHGKREFSKEHIRRLAKRFHVSPELFFR